MIRRALTAAAVAAAIVAVPGVASAHGVNDPQSTPYCGPGQTWVATRCVATVLPPDRPDDGGIFAAIGGAWAAAFLLF